MGSHSDQPAHLSSAVALNGIDVVDRLTFLDGGRGHVPSALSNRLPSGRPFFPHVGKGRRMDSRPRFTWRWRTFWPFPIGCMNDTVGHLGRCPFEVRQEPSQCGLRGNSVAVAPWQGSRDLEGRGQCGLPALEPEGCPGAGPFFHGARWNLRQGLPRSIPEVSASVSI